MLFFILINRDTHNAIIPVIALHTKSESESKRRKCHNRYNASVSGYSAGCQTSNVLALYLPGVVPSELVPSVVGSLVADIRLHGNHTTSGIVGGMFMQYTSAC